ncbi:nuclease-related domain-containing protein [Streptomyces sp. XY431]|uniref:nuclease-related domain-containing protein n=1 Tax=Streptomyces sp. XY431 TaxID=1415562 RepID=UPI0025733CB9|nr:nuclease-related domain-containing protein [Streptomyces sp. XY431]
MRDNGGAGASAERMGARQRAVERAAQHARAKWQLPAAGAAAVAVGWLLGVPWWAVLVLIAAALAVVGRRIYRGASDSWSKGAAGERRTAQLLGPLARDGWRALHDRSVPGSRANVDHLLIGPAGVVVVDSKNWQSKASQLRVQGGQLWYGRYDQTRTLRTAAWEAEEVSRALGVPASTVVAVHGATVPGGVVMLEGVTVIPAQRVRRLLRNLAPQPGYDPARVQQLVDLAERRLPPHSG